VPAFDPVVITVGKIAAGTTDNVIPEQATILGTIRSFSERSRALAHEGVQRVAANIALAHRAEAQVELIHGFPVTVADGRAVALAEQVAADLYGERAWRTMPAPVMGAEDFSYVLQKVPGAMVFLGATPEGGDFRSCCALHSNRMVLDENVMARGVAMHCAFADAFLRDGF
jgi:metal-dependent amidase/aminoacylase/carboxypeptidase family protein